MSALIPPIDERHQLRPLRLEDAEELFALVDANRARLRRWLPWLDRNLTPDDSRAFIASTHRQDEKGTGPVASLLEDDRIIGIVGYNTLDRSNRIGHIGYWLGAVHEGRGLMTAAVRVLVAHGFTSLGLNRQVIACAVGNTRSRAVPMRLGFRLEGVARECEWLYDHFVDHEIHAQTRSDWQMITPPLRQDCLSP